MKDVWRVKGKEGRKSKVGGSGRDESKARYRPSVFYQSVSPPWLFYFLSLLSILLLSIIDTN